MKIKKICKNCGKEYIVEDWKNSKYCSVKCFKRINFQQGKKHIAYKNGAGKGYRYESRKNTIKLLGKQCQICGSEKNINIHHMDMNPRNNKIDNLQVLCSSCHRLIHSKYFCMSKEEKTKIQKEIQLKNTIKWQIKKGLRIPEFEGYIRSKEACEILGISRERLRQIRDRLEYIIPLNRDLLYNKKSVVNYTRKTNIGRPKRLTK